MTFNVTHGLWTSMNTELVPGALKQAVGVVIKRPGMIEKIRPYAQYNSPEDSAAFLTTAPDGIATYNGSLILCDSQNDKVITETAAGSGLFAIRSTTPSLIQLPYSGSHTTAALQAAEANGNVYLSAKAGAVKFDAIGVNGYGAGIQRALDMQLTLVAAGTLLANTNSVAYRLVFGLKDANNNLILGPPCGRAVSTATAAQNVTVKAFIPSAITSAANATSYFVQVYRTPVNTVASTDPGEEMQLVYQATLTATDVANKFVSFTDATPDSLRGAAGYFCPSQEGLGGANYPPPASVDIAYFKQQMYYSNTLQKHRASLQLAGVGANLLTISTAAGGITKSGGNGVYTFTGSPDLTNIPTDGTAKLSATGCTSAANNGEFVITAVNTGAFTITVTNAAAVTEAGAAGARGWPSKLTIAGVNYYGSINGTETVASQIFKVATAGTAQQNVVDTCASLLRVVNQQATPVVYGFYESGPDDGAGKMSFEAVALGASAFTIAASGTLPYNSFNPTIPVASPVTSTNDAAQNRLYVSKTGQPEHVPLNSYFDIGARTAPILRITPLRDALLVWKTDGLFRVVSDGANPAVSPHDRTLALSNIGGVATLGNKAYALTSRGVFSVTESAGTLVSGPVADQFRPLNEDFTNGNFTGVANTVASEIDQCVYFANRSAAQTFLSIYVYCATTGAWTQAPTTETGLSTTNSSWAGSPCVQAGRIFRLVGGGAIMAEVGFDANETILPYNPGNNTPSGIRHPINISAVNAGAHQITATAATGDPGVAVGSTIKENAGATSAQKLYVVTAVSGGVLTLALYNPAQTDTFSFGVTGGTFATRANHYIPITSTVEWVPFTAGDDGEASRYTEVGVLLHPNSSLTAASLNAYTEATASTVIGALTVANTPLPTGISTQTMFRCNLPPSMQTARRLSIIFTHSSGVEVMLITGISYKFEPTKGHALT